MIDCIIDIDERLREAGFTEGNWWHSCVRGEASRKFENYAGNWQVIVKLVESDSINEAKNLLFFGMFVFLMLVLVIGNKRKQIIQVVQYLDERLKELDEEKEELRKYQQLDKQRKSLEFTIYDKELHDARQKLAEVN